MFESIILSVCCHTARVRRKNLTQKELEKIRDYTPALAKGNSRMFRDLRDKGNQSLLIIIYFPCIAYIALIHFICCGSIMSSPCLSPCTANDCIKIVFGTAWSHPASPPHKTQEIKSHLCNKSSKWLIVVQKRELPSQNKAECKYL